MKKDKQYTIKTIWKILLTIFMPVAAGFLFVDGAVAYHPHWAYSIHDYAYGSAMGIATTTTLLAIVFIWLNKPVISLAAVIVYTIPVIRVLVYSSANPESPQAVYYIELLLSLAVIIFVIMGYVNKENVAEDIELKERNVFEEIKKYKGLLDNGAISQEEFEAKKKQLLRL